jgi:hypothetical protein
MTWNRLYLGADAKDAGGIPAHGDQRSERDAGAGSTSATLTVVECFHWWHRDAERGAASRHGRDHRTNRYVGSMSAPITAMSQKARSRGVGEQSGQHQRC